LIPAAGTRGSIRLQVAVDHCQQPVGTIDLDLLLQPREQAIERVLVEVPEFARAASWRRAMNSGPFAYQNKTVVFV
jgi:hypothetical protein